MIDRMTLVSDPRRLTIKQAVTETQSSESTIKRRLLGGAFPDARQDTDGRWLIPVTDLVAAGLRPGKRAKPDPLPTQVTQLENLHAENVDLRTRLAVAEAVAGERERIIGVQERMLRMLEAGQAVPAVESPYLDPVPAIQGQPRAKQSPGAIDKRRWLWRWRRVVRLHQDATSSL